MVPPRSGAHHGTMSLRNQPGLTLLELLCALAVMGVLLGMAAIPVARVGDVLAVRAAREAIVNAAATARALAASHGGAALTIEVREGTLAIATRDGAVADTVSRIARAFRVDVGFDDARLAVATIRFDALGLGRLASRTVHVQRGSARGGVTFSAYGRARAW